MLYINVSHRFIDAVLLRRFLPTPFPIDLNAAAWSNVVLVEVVLTERLVLGLPSVAIGLFLSTLVVTELLSTGLE